MTADGARATLDGTVAGVARAIAAGKLSPVEATAACLERIARLDGRLRSFITVDGERALGAARALEAEAAAGRWRGPLHGVPLAYKDLFAVEGLRASCGTCTPDYFTAGAEATAVARLRAAGAVALGTLNMSELAMGPFGDNIHHGAVDNPWKPGHVSGGSSSGSGAATAARLALGALGTDTGGSIRLPSAACGLTGLKPTYGRVSRAGVMPLSWSHDHVGPMAVDARDVALLLSVIAGHDPRDATSSRRRVPDYAAALDGRVAGLRVGVPENYFFDGLDSEVELAVRAAIGELARLGMRVVPLTLPPPGILVRDVSAAMISAEVATVHARVLHERPGDLGGPVHARAVPGFAVSAVEYLTAARLRGRLVREFAQGVLPRVDVIAAPTIPEPAPALEAATAGSVADIVARMGRFSRLTRPFNVLGLPVLSLPCGFSADGRPIGLQLAGRPFDEATVLRVGDAYQRATGWHLARPPVD